MLRDLFTDSFQTRDFPTTKDAIRAFIPNWFYQMYCLHVFFEQPPLLLFWSTVWTVSSFDDPFEWETIGADAGFYTSVL